MESFVLEIKSWNRIKLSFYKPNEAEKTNQSKKSFKAYWNVYVFKMVVDWLAGMDR